MSAACATAAWLSNDEQHGRCLIPGFRHWTHRFHTRAETQCFKDRTERPVPVQVGEEVQEVLRWGDCQLSPHCRTLSPSEPRPELPSGVAQIHRSPQ